MKPVYQIIADNEDITPVLRPHFKSLTLRDSTGFKSDKLDIVLSNVDGVIAPPPKGAVLQCSVGFHKPGEQPQLYFKGAFTVDEFSESGSPDELGIHAKATDMLDVPKVLRSRAFEATTLGGVIAALARECGWRPVIGAEYAAIPVTYLAQQDESNMHLMTRLGKAYGAVATVKNSHLIFVEQSALKSASGERLSTLTVRKQAVSRWDYQELGRGEYTGVKTHWRDADGAEGAVTRGSDEVQLVIRETFESAEQATGVAITEMARITAGNKNTLSLTLRQADPALMAECEIRADGIRPHIDRQQWVAKDVSLTLSASSGFSGSVSCVRPAALTNQSNQAQG